MSNPMKRGRALRGIRQPVYLAPLLLTCGALSAQHRGRGVRKIVLMHGAWADGSGWKGVCNILVKDGYPPQRRPDGTQRAPTWRTHRLD
jgi:hypothetical protein